METSTPAASLFYRDGRPFTGTPSKSESGKLGTYVKRPCGRCGGAGGADKWKFTGWTCYQCGGARFLGDAFVPVYTADKLEKLNAAQAKRDAKRAADAAAKQAQKQAEADARRAEFEATYADLLKRAERLAEDTVAQDVIRKGREQAKLSDAQVALLEGKLARLDAHEQAVAASQHVGVVGQRIEVPVTVKRVGSFERTPFRTYGRYDTETVWVLTFVDADGNQIIVKSPGALYDLLGVSVAFDDDERGAKLRALEGTPLTLRGTVKEHGEYKGVKQTIVQRAKRVEVK